MNYASVCSGAEAFGPAWHRLGFAPVFHAEIEKHASAVLAHRYPSVPNYGDFTTIATPAGPAPTGPVRLLCGGTPCQTFSVAGLRAGLDSYKGGLSLEFVKLAQRLRAQWILWENVPGVLSADGGEAFGSFLGALAECGYGFAYRVLDAQHFGVPQRRRRVFVVGYLGDWRPAAAVLFEPESLSGDIAPRKKPGKETAGRLGRGVEFGCGVAGTLTATQSGHGPASRNEMVATGYVQVVPAAYTIHGTPATEVASASDTAQCLRARAPGMAENSSTTVVCVTGLRTHTLTANGFDASEDGTGRGTPIVSTYAVKTNQTGANGGNVSHEKAFTLNAADKQAVATYGLSTAVTPKWAVDLSPTICQPSPSGGGQPPAVCHPVPLYYSHDYNQDRIYSSEAIAPCLTAADSNQSRNFLTESAVRRLTPKECERLMGWPDDWTRYGITDKGKPYELADGPRYRICGNGWAAPVVEWIAKRIKEVDSLTFY